MTKFWREGFWRSSVYGNDHWVEGHWVEREDWHRDGLNGSYSAYFRDLVTSARADKSATARYVNPNANCPVCGQPVFFYQNEYGSRVYFDELGPPWPKHPCMDQSAARPSRKSSSRKLIFPALRDHSQVSEIGSWLSLAGLDMSSEFKEKYKTSQWDAWQIDGRFRAAAGVFLVLQSIGTTDPRRLFLSSRRAPRSISRGALVFVHRGRLTYFDLKPMEPIEIEVRRIRTASAFIEELVAKKPETRP